jgi:hypothetical protein
MNLMTSQQTLLLIQMNQFYVVFFPTVPPGLLIGPQKASIVSNDSKLAKQRSGAQTFVSDENNAVGVESRTARPVRDGEQWSSGHGSEEGHVDRRAGRVRRLGADADGSTDDLNHQRL